MKIKSIFLLLICTSLLFCSCSISSVEDYYSTASVNNGISVSISIDCKNIKDSENSNIPSDGMILKKTSYVIAENSTVYDLLLTTVKDKKIPIEVQGNELNKYNAVYIEGIDNIYEFDYGELSGWIFTVNGVQGTESADKYFLKDGDAVEWKYTLNLGKDI